MDWTMFTIGLVILGIFFWWMDRIKEILEEMRDTLDEIKGELEPDDKYDHLDPKNYDEQIRESIREEARKKGEEGK